MPTVSVTVVISLVVCSSYLCDSPIEGHHTMGYVPLRTLQKAVLKQLQRQYLLVCFCIINGHDAFLIILANCRQSPVLVLCRVLDKCM